MEATLFHFVNDETDEEYVVILEEADEEEYKEDAKADGYKLYNECPLEDADTTLPLRTILQRRR